MNALTLDQREIFQLPKQVQRADLSRRSELKFAFAGADLPKLRRILEHQCRRQVHQRPYSVVRSIYFDDTSLSACRANLSGLTQRNKLRIRWYDQPLPGHDFFVEIKWRRNRQTGKHRQPIHSAVPLSQMSYRQIHQELVNRLPSQYTRLVLQYDQPIALVEYCREHYVCESAALRLTIDYDLCFYDQTGKMGIQSRFPKRLPELVVLEGKTACGEEYLLQNLLRPVRKRVGRCSKYVKACHALGLISES